MKWKIITTPFNLTWQVVTKMPKLDKLEHLQCICILNKCLYSGMTQSQDFNWYLVFLKKTDALY